MLFIYFLINLVIFLFFIKNLRLIGKGFISLPGVYYFFSFLPVISLLFYSLMAVDMNRLGFYDYLNAITLHTIFVGLGIFFSYFIFNSKRVPSRDIIHFPSSLKRIPNLFFFIILFISLLIFIHQILVIPKIPFLIMFSESSVSELTMAREGGYKLQGGLSVYFWHFSRMVFIPMLVITSFTSYYMKKDRQSFLVFILILFFGVFNNALSGAKAPVALLFLCILIAYIFLNENLKLRKLCAFLLLIFVFPFLVEYMYSDLNFFESVEAFTLKVVNRFSYETFDRTLSYFDTFPYNIDYLGGRTNSLFLLFSQKEYFNVQNYIFIERLGSGPVKEHLLNGYANAHFIGYMNADFGLVGVLTSCFFIGAILGVIDVFSCNNLNNTASFSLYIVMAFIFWKLMGSQPTSVLFSHGALLAFLLLLFFSKLTKGR